MPINLIVILQLSMTPSISFPPAAQDVPTATLRSGEWLALVKKQVESLKFGSVAITVHEGRVVQIETNLKLRFDKAS